MKKNIVIIALAFLLAFPVLAGTTDFTANYDIIVSAVTFSLGSADLTILNGSTAESWSYNAGTFTVTNPGTFNIGSSDTSVASIKVSDSGGTVRACSLNSSPGTSYVTAPTDTDTYTIAPSASNCTTFCPSITGAVTYNTWPTCGAASCDGSHSLAGSGATAYCAGGGPSGGGGSYLVSSPSPTPSATPTPTPTPTPAKSYSNGSLLRASDSDKVYLIDNEQKRWIPTAEIFTANGYSWSSIKVVDSSVLAQYTEGANVQKVATPVVPTPTIPEGGLIRAKGDVDVYIVKYVGSKKFKRLILSPSVFNSYKHLKWSDVKEVDRSVIDSFVTSDLVRAVGDPKVYKLYPAGDEGEKQWIKTETAFTSRGFDWDAIYEINQVDRNSYKEGAVLE